jgi:hypothetical protein
MSVIPKGKQMEMALKDYIKGSPRADWWAGGQFGVLASSVSDYVR